MKLVKIYVKTGRDILKRAIVYLVLSEVTVLQGEGACEKNVFSSRLTVYFFR